MSKTEVVRVDSALVEAARANGAVMGRTVADQLSHWARLGRATEAAGVPTTTIHDVLEGQARFDELDAEEQDAVAELWQQRITDLLGGLDLRKDFEAASQSYAELDDDGNVVVTSGADVRRGRPRHRGTAPVSQPDDESPAVLLPGGP